MTAMDVGLTIEQHLQLRLLREDARNASREQLIEMLVDERAAALLAQREYQIEMTDAGLIAESQMDMAFVLPEAEEELVAVFGYSPSNEELGDYLNERIGSHMDAARMDVDIEAIALEAEG